MSQHRTTRRTFIKLAGWTILQGAALAGTACRTQAAPAKSRAPVTLKRPLSPQAFKEHLAGPILSLPTTFHADLSVNTQAVRNMVERAMGYGVPVVALTAGNSKYACLSYEEIKEVTAAMTSAVQGRALTIAATGDWPTQQVIDYAHFAQAQGADALQIMLPKNLKTEDEQFEHFRQIADQTSLPLALHGIYSVPLLRRLVQIESIVAMKEDTELTYYIDRMIEFGGRLEIFAGGAENRYLVGYPYGARAFYATYTGFAPDKPMMFWEAIRADDLPRAVAITRQYDYPFIRRFSHPFWHATLEYFGLAQRYMRPPFETWPEAKMPEIKAFFDEQGIHPADYST